jgi:hypothetical protein
MRFFNEFIKFGLELIIICLMGLLNLRNFKVNFLEVIALDRPTRRFCLSSALFSHLL